MILHSEISSEKMNKISGNPDNALTASAGFTKQLGEYSIAPGKRSSMLAAMLFTVLVHATVILSLLWMGNEKSSHRPMLPLEVSLVRTPPPPQPAPPRPKPVARPVLVPPKPQPLPEPVKEIEPPPVEEPQVNPEPVQEEPPPPPIEPPIYEAAYLNNPKPPYPPIAKRLHIQGTVLVRALVNPAGSPENVELARSSGSEVLDEAALKAVMGWKFVPARQGDQTVTATVEIPIHFHLTNLANN
jgi:protein TonB